MSEEKWAIITGADGGMGTEITRAVAEAGYHIIMALFFSPPRSMPLSSVQSGTDTAASSERDRKRKPGSHGSRSVFYGIDSFFCRSDCGASSPRFPADE